MLALAVISVVSAYVISACAAITWVRANPDRFMLAAGQERPWEGKVLVFVGIVLLCAGAFTLWAHYQLARIGLWGVTAGYFAVFVTPSLVHNRRLRRRRVTEAGSSPMTREHA